VLAWIISALPVEAAAPRLLIVYGPPLTRPVILDDWQENLTLMLAATDNAGISADALQGRPYVRLAFFWGPEWAQYVDAGKPLSALRPEQGNQHGRFYPAVGNEGPILTFDDRLATPANVRRLDQTGVSVLAHHGIPTHYPAPRPPSTPPFALMLAAGLMVAVFIAVVVTRLVKPNCRAGG